MKVQKTREVRTPSRATDVAAGIDFYIPFDFNNYQPFKVSPGQSINVPSGIVARVPDGYALIAFNKSGIASKYGLFVGACVVDQDYQGEIHLNLMNVGDGEIVLNPGQKIMQFVLIKMDYQGVEVVKSAWEGQETQRKAGWAGSSDHAKDLKVMDDLKHMQDGLKKIFKMETGETDLNRFNSEVTDYIDMLESIDDYLKEPTTDKLKAIIDRESRKREVRMKKKVEERY